MALWHPFRSKQVGKGREREKIKNSRSAPFLPDTKQKIPKNSKKIKKVKKKPLCLQFKPKIGWKGRGKR